MSVPTSPAALPDEVLQRPDVQQALARRDFGRLFYLARKWGGISYSKIALTCDIKPERVGVLARGKGAITSHEKILQIADGLRIPGRLLGLLPRPWEADAPPAPRPAAASPAALQRTTALPASPPESARSIDGTEQFMGASPSTTAPGAPVEVVQSFRLADRRMGGGHLYAAVLHYLTTQVGPELVAESAGAPFVAAAGLTEMAGWMAHDAGRDHAASRHFHRSLQLAQAAESPALTAQVWASHSHLSLHRHDGDTALFAAERGYELLDGSEDTAVRGRLLAMRARSHAVRGDAAACREALDQAERVLTSSSLRYGSQWASPFDEGSLASEAARSMCDVGDFAAAASFATRALEARAPERMRARTFASLVLARALVGQGEIERACTITLEVGESTGPVGSLVVADQFAQAVHGLVPFAATREVGGMLPRLQQTVSQHKRMYHWLAAERDKDEA
ncbi:hypothetical protein GCM10023224_15930 [Streptomonospora halophila]|uniref:XRE family transcriptional regulator n=1 Tax=Streptomonospora halophila TaxID=427369 RepID=A0ABP9GB96_9ACTN